MFGWPHPWFFYTIFSFFFYKCIIILLSLRVDLVFSKVRSTIVWKRITPWDLCLQINFASTSLSLVDSISLDNKTRNKNEFNNSEFWVLLIFFLMSVNKVKVVYDICVVSYEHSCSYRRYSGTGTSTWRAGTGIYIGDFMRYWYLISGTSAVGTLSSRQFSGTGTYFKESQRYRYLTWRFWAVPAPKFPKIAKPVLPAVSKGTAMVRKPKNGLTFKVDYSFYCKNFCFHCDSI